jgi:Flp pilus assembly pilin Flp
MPTYVLKSFLSNESGAVTVDWVVLTAALVGLGLAVMSVVSGGLENLSGDIADQLGEDHVSTGFAASTATTTTTTTD